jgi:hypothetical protein
MGDIPRWPNSNAPLATKFKWELSPFCPKWTFRPEATPRQGCVGGKVSLVKAFAGQGEFRKSFDIWSARTSLHNAHLPACAHSLGHAPLGYSSTGPAQLPVIDIPFCFGVRCNRSIRHKVRLYDSWTNTAGAPDEAFRMLPIPRAVLAFVLAFDLLVFTWIAYRAATFSNESEIQCIDDSP